MKKPVMRFIALILVLVMSITALTSCFAPSDTTPPDDGETPGDSTTPTPDGEEDEIDPIEADKTLIDDPNFDYLNSDLSAYINMPAEKYKGFSLQLNVASPHAIDVDVAILKALYSERSETAGETYTYPQGVSITAGDQVAIYYRGYLLDEDGNEVFAPNMCNYVSDTPGTLGIGSGQFVSGFELSLVGKNPADYGQLTRVKDGRPTEDGCAYISYTRTLDGVSESVDTYRVDMSGDVDAILGEGMKTALLGANVGDRIEKLETTVDGKSCVYSNLTIQLATYESDPITVECYFSAEYPTVELRNVTAYFDVFVTSVTTYDTPEFDDEFVGDLLDSEGAKITREELEAYPGETLADKYRSYAKEVLDKSYDEDYISKLTQAIWQYYVSDGVAEMKAYPKALVKGYYDQYISELTAEFEAYGGMIYDQYTGGYKTCATLSEFCTIYFGRTSWREYLVDLAKSILKERIILYHIIKEEGLALDAAELDAAVTALRESYIADYMQRYLDYVGKTREDYTDEEYAALLETNTKDLMDYYGEEYFVESVYYEHAMKTIIYFPNVTTLDKY